MVLLLKILSGLDVPECSSACISWPDARVGFDYHVFFHFSLSKMHSSLWQLFSAALGFAQTSSSSAPLCVAVWELDAGRNRVVLF